MPSGSTHAALSTLALVALPVALAIWTTAPIVPVACGLVIGWLVSPDLDQEAVKTVDEQRWHKVPVVGWLWSALWWPYARIVPHRSFWSHAPVVGTIGRLLYLAIPTWLVGRWLDVTWPAVEPRYLWYALGGWCAQDALHWVLDWVF